jgi:hypothetical protein
MNFDKAAFEKMAATKRAGVESARQANFWEGFVRVLTQLYPDNAHFIYELLQNAEDAKASHARFRLTMESLIFEHDGSRLFSTSDVESITSIGDSTKTDSRTEIGKFGVGFKAVFAYTQTPEIQSGEYHFRIRDLVVPEALPPSPIGGDGFSTRFTFPFDHQKKNGLIAMAEIAAALQALGDATLLFLSNIGRISYVLPDGSIGNLERVLPSEMQQAASNGEHIQVTVNSPTCDSRRSNWLRYRRTVTIEDESTRKECVVAVAFSLAEEEGRAKKSKWRMIPLNPGRVCIYFPAEKEPSYLRFHLHAPFASTVARDSVRDSRGNDQLLAAIAELTAASMEDIRDRGLLTVEALEVLPIKEDNLPKFYEPIREKIVDAFSKQDLVPTRSGGYRASGGLFRGPADLAALLNDNDLVRINGKNWIPRLWCANPPQLNQRADKFLDSLSLEEWEWWELRQALDCDSSTIEIEEDDGRPKRLKAWFSSKDDAWLQKFYALLHDSRHQFDVSELSFVRVQKGGEVYMVRPRDAFFPVADNDRANSDVLWVKEETYSSGKSENQKNSARLFLERNGVQVFDEKTELARLLETYGQLPFHDETTHIRDVKRFVQFFRKHPNDKHIFSAKYFLVGTKDSTSNERHCCTPTQLCLDMPYENTGFAAIASSKGKYLLWDGYANAGLGGDFVEFAKAVGVQAEFSIRRVSAEGNPNWPQLSAQPFKVRTTESGFNEDWTIDGLKRLVEKPSIESSRLIWRALISAEKKMAWARYRPNQKYDVRSQPSQLICHLRGSAWIPDCDGNFFSPQELSRTRLRPDFLYDPRNELLDAIGFEHSIQRKTEEYQGKDRVAREIGFSGVDDATKVANAARMAGLNAAGIVALIEKNSPKPDQPEEEVRNPERRRKGVLEQLESAPAREAVRRERSIQPDVSSVVAEAKAYLRAKYTNVHGQMVCQACQCEMPFKLGTGEYYFEAVEIFKGLAKHFFQNRLALCPTCAAMYLYARSCSDDELRQQISAVVSESAAVELNVELAGDPHVLRFVGTHFFDLRNISGRSQSDLPTA